MNGENAFCDNTTFELARWRRRGLAALLRQLPGGRQFGDRLRGRVREVLREPPAANHSQVTMRRVRRPPNFAFNVHSRLGSGREGGRCAVDAQPKLFQRQLTERHGAFPSSQLDVFPANAPVEVAARLQCISTRTVVHGRWQHVLDAVPFLLVNAALERTKSLI
jgi:hypothetical protein